MKTKNKILIAFLLNLAFSVFEFFGGIYTGSVAIISDALHDLGDAVGIGTSFFFEKKSGGQPDEQYSYGYARYSVLGSVLTTVVLLLGSAAVIYNAVYRLFVPVPIRYDGMIVFAVVGICVNAAAAFVTREGDSLNQKAVNLHMLEDVLGWAVVLVGAVVMKFTDFAMLDAWMSIGVAVFILVHAVINLKETLNVFLEKVPQGVDMEEIRKHILALDGVLDVHHMHIWSMDGQRHYATMHVVTDAPAHAVKEKIRAHLHEHGIGHVTLELEAEGEHCHEQHCRVECHAHGGHHHHHHHH